MWLATRLVVKRCFGGEPVLKIVAVFGDVFAIIVGLSIPDLAVFGDRRHDHAGIRLGAQDPPVVGRILGDEDERVFRRESLDRKVGQQVPPRHRPSHLALDVSVTSSLIRAGLVRRRVGSDRFTRHITLVE
jgi:hypothetical protein